MNTRFHIAFFLLFSACGAPPSAAIDARATDAALADANANELDAGLPQVQVAWDRIIDEGPQAGLEGTACGPNRLYSFGDGDLVAVDAAGDERGRYHKDSESPEGFLIGLWGLVADSSGVSGVFSAPANQRLFVHFNGEMSLLGFTQVIGALQLGTTTRGLQGTYYELSGRTVETTEMRLLAVELGGQSTVTILEEGSIFQLSPSRGVAALPNGKLLACVSHVISTGSEYVSRLIEIDPTTGAIVRDVSIGDAYRCEIIPASDGFYTVWLEINDQAVRYVAGKLNAAGDGWVLEPREVWSAPRDGRYSGPSWQLHEGTLYALRQDNWVIDRIDAATLVHKGFVEVPRPRDAYLGTFSLHGCNGGLYLFYRVVSAQSEIHLALLGTMPP